MRWPRSLSTTEALAGRDSPKSESLPIAMCTRALDTSESVAMVRADLTFERAAIVHLLEELGGAERRAIEELESNAPRRRKTL